MIHFLKLKYPIISLSGLLLLILCIISECGTVPPKPLPIEYAEVLFGGDVMLDWGVKSVSEKKGNDYILKVMKPFLDSFDYRFCNLECPISRDGEPLPGKKYIFLADPKLLKILTHGGIDGVSLANNHSKDYGNEALLNTIKNLSLNKIHFTGAGVDLEMAHVPILINIRGIRIAIFAYSNIGYSTNYAQAGLPGVAMLSLSQIKRDISKYRKYNDFIAVSLHWGEEYADYPTPYQITMAHSIINSGADLILGHHSHIYQGIEIYKGKPIFYSLGNFIFGSVNEDIRNNILVSVRFSKKHIESFRVIPVNGNISNQNRFQQRVLGKDNAKSLFTHLKKISKQLKSDFPEISVQENSYLMYHFPGEDDSEKVFNTAKN